MTKDQLISTMMQYLEEKEDYESCAKLKSAQDITTDSTLDISEYLKQTYIIVGFDDNCQVCWEVFDADDDTPCYAIDKSLNLDYIKLMTILVNYYFDREDFAKCKRLSEIRDEIIHEITNYDDPFPSVTIHSDPRRWLGRNK